MSRFVLAALVFSAPLLAQSPKVTTAPPGYEAKSGQRYSYAFGRLPDARFQTAESSLRGRALAIAKVDYRTQSFYSYTTYRGMGRSWSSVSLMVGETDIAKMSTDWAKNHVTEPTTVFRGRATWPSITSGIPGQVWGNTATFPFVRAVLYSGRRDLLLDYEFSGGVLSNGATWNAGHGDPYYMDATNPASPSSSVYVGNTSFPARRPACADGKSASGSGAFTYSYGYVYSDEFATASLRGKAILRAYSGNMAPNSRALAGVSLAGNAVGIDIGARCNRFHLDPRFLVGVLARRTSNVGSVSGWVSPEPVPYDNAYAGAQVWMQAAWKESTTRRLSLTTATRLVLPRKPGGNALKRTVYRYYGRTYMSTQGYVATLPRFTLR